MADVLIYQTDDNGEINIESGTVEMTGGLDTSAYLSMFGGNVADDGRPGNDLQWWGNLDETDDAYKYRSETQHLLGTIPPTSFNRLRIQDAATRDLQWLLDEKIISELTVEVSLLGWDKVGITVSLTARGDPSEFNYVENWGAVN